MVAGWSPQYASVPMRLISENTSSFTAKLAEWPQIATLTTVPPGRTDPTALASTASTPAHSNATSAPLPPVRSRIAEGTSTSVGSSTSSAPAPGALALRTAAGSTTKTFSAPAALSAAVVTRPIGPEPNTAAVSPGLSPESRTAW